MTEPIKITGEQFRAEPARWWREVLVFQKQVHVCKGDEVALVLGRGNWKSTVTDEEIQELLGS